GAGELPEHAQELAHAQRGGEGRQRDDDRRQRENREGNPGHHRHPRRDHRGHSAGTLALSSGGAVVCVNGADASGVAGAGPAESARNAKVQSGTAESCAAATRSTIVVSSGPAPPYKGASLVARAATTRHRPRMKRQT